MNRRRLTVSVRVLMLLVLAVAAWLGWVTNRARQQREAVAAVKAFGGWVHYNYEFAPTTAPVPPGNQAWGAPGWGKLVKGSRPWAPDWLRRLAGDEYFRDIAHVSLLSQIDIAGGRVHLDQLSRGPADDVLAKLEGQTGIRTLQLGGTQATDRGLESIGTLTGLEELLISWAPEVTDAGVAHLKGLRNLRILWLRSSKVTDRGLEHLEDLHGLEELWLGQSAVTDAGVERLSKAIPGLVVEWNEIHERTTP